MTGKDYLKQLTKDGTKVIFTAADVIEAYNAGMATKLDKFLLGLESEIKKNGEMIRGLNGTKNKNQA